MNKHKKAFTLVEVLGVIVVIGILSLLVIASIQSYLNEGKKTYNNNLKEQLLIAGKEYYSTNKELLPYKQYNEKAGIKKAFITAEELNSKNYLKDKLIDSEGTNCDQSFILVRSPSNADYEYHSCLICGETNYSKDDQYCNIKNWGDNTAPTCKITLNGETEDIIITNNNYSDLKFSDLSDNDDDIDIDSKESNKRFAYIKITKKDDNIKYIDVSNLEDDEIKNYSIGADLINLKEGTYSVSVIDKGLNETSCISNVTVEEETITENDNTKTDDTENNNTETDNNNDNNTTIKDEANAHCALKYNYNTNKVEFKTVPKNSVKFSIVKKGKKSNFSNNKYALTPNTYGKMSYRGNVVTSTGTNYKCSLSFTRYCYDKDTGYGLCKPTNISIKWNSKTGAKGRCGSASRDYCAAIATVKYPIEQKTYYVGYQNNSGLLSGSCRSHAFMAVANSINNTYYSTKHLQNYLYSIGYKGVLWKGAISKAAKKYNLKATIYHNELSQKKAATLIKKALNNGQPVMIFVANKKCSDLAGTHHALLLLGYNSKGNVVFVDSVPYAKARSGKRSVNALSKCMSTGKVANSYYRMIIFSYQ